MHNRSQISAGPSFSAAPMTYSASLDEYFAHADPVTLAPYSYEDSVGDNLFNAPSNQVTYARNSFEPTLNSAFVAPELDDCASLHSGFSGSGI